MNIIFSLNVPSNRRFICDKISKFFANKASPLTKCNSPAQALRNADFNVSRYTNLPVNNDTGKPKNISNSPASEWGNVRVKK
jgi:hypothetical protein